MSQHFLLSAKARTLSVRKVMELTADQAFHVFKEMRWGAGDEATKGVRLLFVAAFKLMKGGGLD